MGSHLIDGEFQSDKYPDCPRGKVPLSIKDKDAQPLLWIYAELHRGRDPEFSDDVQAALRLAGYDPPPSLEGTDWRRLLLGVDHNGKPPVITSIGGYNPCAAGAHAIKEGDDLTISVHPRKIGPVDRILVVGRMHVMSVQIGDWIFVNGDTNKDPEALTFGVSKLNDQEQFLYFPLVHPNESERQAVEQCAIATHAFQPGIDPSAAERLTKTARDAAALDERLVGWVFPNFRPAVVRLRALATITMPVVVHVDVVDLKIPETP